MVAPGTFAGFAAALLAGAAIAVAVGFARARERSRRLAAELRERNARLEQLAREVQAINAEFDAFTSSVSHDLRAPLRAMSGFAAALLEDYGPQLDPTAQDYARRIVAAATRMDSIIHDLSNYSRLTRAEIALRPTGLDDVVAAALEQLDAQVRDKQARVTVEQPLPVVRGHRSTLVQIVANLLGNSLNYMQAGVPPEIRVWAERNGGNARLWVVDNGIGIAPEHHERVFRIFERLHGSETYPGSGLGLAIVRKGVERMGGRVGLESELGRGARFWIELPLSQAAG